MTAFMMIHPTDVGDETFAHCGDCGVFEPLGITIHADDEVAEEFLSVWESHHACGGLNTTGLLLFGTDDEVNRAFGFDA